MTIKTIERVIETSHRRTSIMIKLKRFLMTINALSKYLLEE